MAQEQNYQVNYSINVDASQGTKQVIAFGEAVGKLVQAKASLTPAVTNIKNMMDEIDRVFRTKNGKKRNFDYRLTIDTKKSEEKLERIKGLLTDISTLSKGISLTINAGQALDSKKIKANAKSLYEKKAAEMRKAEIEKNAASSVGTMADAQKRITKAIGKINSALVSMERDRELQIKTGTAENRLQQILSLLGRIKSASVISFNMQGGIPSEGLTPSVPVPYAPQAFVMPEKARQKLIITDFTDFQRIHFSLDALKGGLVNFSPFQRAGIQAIAAVFVHHGSDGIEVYYFAVFQFEVCLRQFADCFPVITGWNSTSFKNG